ncbi:hypothetical protein JCM15060_14000 [Halanaerobaculum tunisiense]
MTMEIVAILSPLIVIILAWWAKEIIPYSQLVFIYCKVSL